MAKATAEPATQAKGKAKPNPVEAGKTAKTVAAAPAKKIAGKKAPVKAVAPKVASAPNKAKAPPAKKIAAKGRPPAARKAAVQKAAAPKKAATSKKAAPKMEAVKKTASSKAAASKTAAKIPGRKTGAKTAVKTVAVKKAAPRRPVVRVTVPTPAARRGRPKSAPRKAQPATPRNAPAATPRKPGGAKQAFTVSHLNEADFRTDGLRSYAQYRDLGIAAATAGLCQAHVIRMVPPCTDEVRKRHLHHADLQLVYVLKGWMKNEFEGHGEQMMSAGSCWLQPAGIKHTVLDYSADCEVLEIIVPADFKTEELT